MNSSNSEQTITITKTQFMKVMNEVSKELNDRHPAFPLIVTLVSALVIQRLFDQDKLQIVKENES